MREILIQTYGNPFDRFYEQTHPHVVEVRNLDDLRNLEQFLKSCGGVFLFHRATGWQSDEVIYNLRFADASNALLAKLSLQY